MHLNYGVGPQLLEAMQTRGFLLQCGPILFKLFRCEEFPRAVPLTLPVCQDNPVRNRIALANDIARVYWQI